MNHRRISSHFSALSQAWAVLHLHWRALLATRSSHGHHYPSPRRVRALLRLQRPLLRGLLVGGIVLVALGSVTTGYFVWRLATGPLALDMVTPWLTAAIEERFGGRNRVEVGGTQLERDEGGRTALRLRDIVVRDRHGTIVASAPKAEVGISAASLLTGQLQAVRLSLIGAGMAVRVEQDGQLTIFAGAHKEAITAPAVTGTIPSTAIPVATTPAPGTQQAGPDVFAALLTWLEGLDVLGLDGRDLSEIGLKNGSLLVDDRRNGKQWKFENINLSLTRPKEGGVALTVSSSGTDGPWSLTATVTPRGEGRRAIEAVFRDISPRDIFLALRIGDGVLDADMPLSAIVRAELNADGTVSMAEGRVVAGAGHVADIENQNNRLLVDEARIDWRWDPGNRVFTMPIEVQSGANRLSLLAQVDPPRETGGPWAFSIMRGMLMLASNDRVRDTPLVLDRVQLRGRIDPAKRRVEIDQGDIAGVMAGLAFSGALDYSGPDPRLSFGLAGTRMAMSAFKRLWPFFVAPDVRAWVLDHVAGGTIDRVVVATNATLPAFKKGGPPMPDDGLSVEIVANASLRPIDTLPLIRDADIVARITGRHTKVTMGRGSVDLPSGRKLTVSNGVFEIADTHVKPPPARLRMRLDGPVDAGIELAAIDPLRGAAGNLSLDPATTRGTMAAQVSVDWPLTRDLPKDALVYQIDADVANFSAERLVRGLKGEAGALRVTARPQGVQVKGDLRIGGTPASIDYKTRIDGDADVRVNATLDDSARSRLGFDVGDALSGPIAVKMSGRLSGTGEENRFAIDADLTQTKVSDLLPGWSKAAGKPVRATFTLVEKAQSRRVEDLSLEGSGARLKGSVEMTTDGDVVSANFPTFALSDGDKASLKVERAADGTTKVTLRGDVYDGRGFIKTALAGRNEVAGRRSPFDLDLDVKVGAVAGFNGEAMRGLELRMSRRSGEIRSLSLAAKLGRESPFLGDLRGRGGRPIVFLETADAGALLRFSDMYPRVSGGQMWVEMEPPSADHRPSDGIVNIRDFQIVGEPALDRMAANPNNDGGARVVPPRSAGVQFTRMRVEFTRSPGRLSMRDGVVSGPAIGATVEGQIDFLREDVRLRGTLVPAYALNNIPAQLPILGIFLGGGKNEGLLGVTYEVVGPPNGMIMRVNPMSAVAPGFLRKLFEFRSTDEQAWTRPPAAVGSDRIR